MNDCLEMLNAQKEVLTRLCPSGYIESRTRTAAAAPHAEERRCFTVVAPRACVLREVPDALSNSDVITTTLDDHEQQDQYTNSSDQTDYGNGVHFDTPFTLS